jgi:hypothetical protein
MDSFQEMEAKIDVNQEKVDSRMDANLKEIIAEMRDGEK